MRRNILRYGAKALGPFAVAAAVAAALTGISLLGGVSLLGGGASAGNAVTDVAVRDAFTLAVQVDQGVQVPPVAVAGERALDADLNRQLDEGSRAIHSIFADEPAARLVKGLENAVESQRKSGDRMRILGAGIGPVKFEEVALSGSTAKVRAVVETWSRTQVKQVAVAGTANKPAFGGADKWVVVEPHNMLNVSATLTQDKTGRWIVSEYGWTFAGGSGP